LEAAKGFKESTAHSKFFRKGKSKEWKTLLTSRQIDAIERKLHVPMQYPGYL